MGEGSALFELAHAFAQHPQRAVELYVLVDPGYFAGSHGAARGRPATQPAPDQVFLNPIERRPQVISAILGPARAQQLVGRNRRGHVGARFVLQRQCGFSEQRLFLGLQRHALHAFLLLADQVEAVEHVVSALDHVMHDVAFVRHADTRRISFARCCHGCLASNQIRSCCSWLSLNASAHTWS